MLELTVDFKFVENYIRDKFMRPFKRRLKYIYFGLDVAPDTFVLSTTDDTEFKYCEPLQATGIVQILNPEHLEKIEQWLAYCQLDQTKPFVCYFELLVQSLSKEKWDNPHLRFEQRPDEIVLHLSNGAQITIARRVETYFTLSKLQQVANEYRDALLSDRGFYFDTEYTDTQSTSLVKQAVDCSKFDARYVDVTLVLLVGLDLLVQKSLIVKDVPHASAIRMWTAPSVNSFRFGSYYKTADLRIAVARDNIFVFPKKRIEGVV